MERGGAAIAITILRMGSPNGIWTAVSGAMAQSQSVDSISNNIANTNTVGYKKDDPTFKEYLTTYERVVDPVIDIPRTNFKDSDFYKTDGREFAMVNVDKVVTDHSQGTLRVTNAPFDLAVDGPGFFALKTPSGLMFTRSGDFKVNADGKLVTTDGFPVLALSQVPEPVESVEPAEPGRKPASMNPFMISAAQLNAKADPNDPGATKPSLEEIDLKDILSAGKKILITGEGDLYAGNEKIAKLAVAEFADAKLLRKTTSTAYVNPDPVNVPRVGDQSKTRQGFLEMSNVNPVSELVNLLKANRLFESNMRAIKTYGEMSGKEANEVGKL